LLIFSFSSFLELLDIAFNLDFKSFYTSIPKRGFTILSALAEGTKPIIGSIPSSYGTITMPEGAGQGLPVPN
jgi:hypothetical protein